MSSARIAAKRLAEVEVDPSKSHQHEFNAGKLRKELGFDLERTSGKMEFLFYTADDAAPINSEESFTLYDAREAVPGRTEWRLYYTSNDLSVHARPGDLMLVLRADTRTADLLAVVVRAGTRAEQNVLAQLIGHDLDSGKISFVDSSLLNREGVQSLLAPLRHAETDQPPLPYNYRSHRLYKMALEANRIPRPKVMSSAAHDILREVFPHGLDPDEFIEQALAAESELFFAIEDAIGNKALLAKMKQSKMDFAAVMKFAMSYSQSRRARRGDSLQNHFAQLLTNLEISFTEQCETERGETPDFVFPSCDAYHDLKFPDDRLRMVGCKTKVRERWGQWLKEAERIERKFALCVDDGLSNDVILKCQAQLLRFFLPQHLIDSAYHNRPVQKLLGSVTDLVTELRAAAV